MIYVIRSVNVDNSSLLLKIERCRAEMVYLGKEYGLSSNEVIHASKRLDGLLNEYRSLNEASRGET